MKTEISNLIKGAIAVLMLIVMASCGGSNPSVEDVVKTLDAGKTPTESEYASIIKYCGDYAKEAQKYYDIINAQPNDSTAEAVKATDNLASLYAKYPYLDKFRDVLAKTELSKLGAKNEAKVNEYAKYQGFPLPVGEGADLRDPNVVGMVQDMPDSAVTDTTGLLSTGDGEAVGNSSTNAN